MIVSTDPSRFTLASGGCRFQTSRDHCPQQTEVEARPCQGDGAQLKVTQDVISRAQGRKPRPLGPSRSLPARGHSKPWAWAARPWGSDPQHHRGCCSRRGGCAGHGEVIIGVTPGSDTAAHSPLPAAAHRSHGAPSFGSAVSSGRAPSQDLRSTWVTSGREVQPPL